MQVQKARHGYKIVKSLYGKYEEIPEEWEYRKLSDLSEKEKDIVAGPFGSNLVVSDYRTEGVPIIRLQNIGRNTFINKNIQFISKEKAEELKYHSYKPDDLVLAKLGDPIGKTCRIPKNFPAGIVVADVVRIRTSETKSDSSFIEYALNSEICERQRERLEKIIQDEYERRKKNVNYFTSPEQYEEIYNLAIHEEQERQKVFGDYVASPLEFSIYGELNQIQNDRKNAINLTKDLYSKIQPETEIIEWKNNTDTEKRIKTIIYDTLSEAKFSEDKIEELMDKIITLTKNRI